MFASMSLKAKG
jgi:hypothetical protein